MGTQKIVNLLGDAGSKSSKFATRKWYVMNDQHNTDYGEGNERGTTVVIIQTLVTGDITETCGDANTRVAFENCAPFTKCITHINDKHVDGVDNLDIIMPMYNLVEYRNNYGDTLGRLW